MDDQEILALYDAEMRIDPPTEGAKVHCQPGLTVCEALGPSPHGGWVIYTNLSATRVDDAIQAQLEHFARQGRGFEWKVFDHDQPANLKQRLLAHGFRAQAREALAVLDLEAAPPVLWQPITHSVRRLTLPSEVDQMIALEEAVWNEPHTELGERLKNDLVTMPDDLHIYAALLEERFASAAWIYYHPNKPFADLFGGATRPEYRGRGLYTALVAARAQEARQRGVRFLTVDASPMSRPILEKLNFRVLLYSQPFVWEPEN